VTRVIMKANAEYDLPGSDDFKAFRREMMDKFSILEQQRFRGEKLMRFPIQNVLCTSSGTLNIGAQQTGVQAGPDQGFIWRVARLTVVSSGADNGTPISPGPQVVYYTTSDGAVQERNFIDGTQQVGAAFFPGSRGWYLMPGEGVLAVVNGATAGNTYTVTGQIASVPAEMQGKLI
jgi:hypothetical protein